jgi:uncharacterized membrane protein
MGLVTLLVALFAAYFILYLAGLQDAFLTNAEDMGIMDQAIWSTIHGHLLHQTICNIVNDTNCYTAAGVMRFAIHFEPILLPTSLLYLAWPDPKALQVLQTLIVAGGAYPAFWLARLRLRNEWASVAVALLYLLYPAQQYALVFDFHAVTFTASLLLFSLYFMYTRRTAWLFVFAVLAMACKEEIPVLVAGFGLWSMLLQRRWRSGLLLALLAMAWTVVSLLVVHLSSPLGHSPLTSRYSYLGGSLAQIVHTLLLHPRAMLRQHVLEQSHRAYLNGLLASPGYLPLFAPWVLVLALPTLLLNLFSSDPGMYSGIFQYNAEFVPVLIFATIEAVVLILALARRLAMPEQGRRLPWLQHALLALLLAYTLVGVVRADASAGAMPWARGFRWPLVSAHDELARRFIALLPPAASVSAQTHLVPHLSQRLNVYMFPYADEQADYILLDLGGDRYPFASVQAYQREVKQVLRSGQYGILAAQDGYLLLKRGLAPPAALPAALSP